MKIEHIALASNSEKESDDFYIKLLGLKKIKTFTVSSDNMMQFFNIKEEHQFIRYQKQDFSVEVIITNKTERVKDRYTHSCILVEDGINLLKRAAEMGYKTIKVPRSKDNGYYLFLKDNFGNIFEIKNVQ